MDSFTVDAAVGYIRSAIIALSSNTVDSKHTATEPYIQKPIRGHETVLSVTAQFGKKNR